MPQIKLKKPDIPETLEADIMQQQEAISKGDIVRAIEARSALEGYRMLLDMYNVFKEYPELTTELFYIDEG